MIAILGMPGHAFHFFMMFLPFQGPELGLTDLKWGPEKIGQIASWHDQNSSAEKMKQSAKQTSVKFSDECKPRERHGILQKAATRK